MGANSCTVTLIICSAHHAEQADSKTKLLACPMDLHTCIVMLPCCLTTHLHGKLHYLPTFHCDFRESSPRPSEQPRSRRGTSISRPLSYVGGAAVREDRRLHLVPVFRHAFHIAFDVVATAVRSEATRQTPKPKRKIDRQTRRQSRTKPLSVTAVRKALRGETHRGGEETRDAKPQPTQRARRALARE